MKRIDDPEMLALAREAGEAIAQTHGMAMRLPAVEAELRRERKKRREAVKYLREIAGECTGPPPGAYARLALEFLGERVPQHPKENP